MAATRTKATSRQGSSHARPSASRPGPRPPRRRRRSPLRALPGALGALLVLAVLLVGVPEALLYGTRAVSTMGGVGHQGIGQLLTSPDDGRLFLWALVAIGWVAWGCFALSVLLEIPAQLRGRVVRRLPAFGWSQRLAGGLVGAVIALLPVAGGAFAATASPGQLAIAAAPTQAGGGTQSAVFATTSSTTTSTTVQAADSTSSGPTYTVKDSRPADSLWSIAEHQLGSGDRWQEIAKLNAGRVMDSSGTVFDADRPIQPGWQLLMPADAKPDGAPATTQAAPAPAANGPQHATVTVRPGDTLSGIAQREMGSSDAWPKLFDANKGVTAPDGTKLTDPNNLEPGMVLTIPGAATQTTSAPAATNQSAPVQSSPTTSPAPIVPDVSPHPTPHPTPHLTAPAHTAAHPTAHGEDSKDSYAPALAASGIGVLLAAVLIGAVAHRRGQQQRTRRPRRRIPMPTPPAAAFEAELKARQGGSGLDLLNRSLRTLGRNVSRTGKRLPPLAAVRVTNGGVVELHLAAAAVPIAPFRAAHAANVWWCSADSGDLLSAQQAAKVPAPYPALVTLGTAPDGAAVLADLETIRLMHLSGHPEDSRAVLRTIALELAHSPLADRLNLHLIGFPEELPVSDTVADRVHRYQTLAEALTELGPRIDQARGALLQVGAAHPRDARSRGEADAAWVPDIVLSAQPPTGEVPTELGRLLDGRPRTCLAVISRAPERGSGPVARWTLPSTGATVLPGLHLAVQLQRLTDEQFDHWAELLSTTAVGAEEPAPDWTYDGDEMDPAELPKPEPVLAGVASGTAGFMGGALPDGPPETGPRLIARLIGTGSSPFASVDPAGSGGTGYTDRVVLPGQRHGGNSQGLHATGQVPAPLDGVAPLERELLADTQPLDAMPVVDAQSPVELVPFEALAGVAESEPVAFEEPVPFGEPMPFEEPVPFGEPMPFEEPAPELPPAADPTLDTPVPVNVPATTAEPTPTHETALAAGALDPRVPLRPEPVPATPPGGTSLSARTDADDLLAILRSPEAHTIRTTPRVRLLGPVDVVGAAGAVEPVGLPALTEAAAFLALNPGADPVAVHGALHPGDHARPDQPAPASLEELAAWFGGDPDGRAFLRQEELGSCSFAPTVTCDWDEFRSLYRRGMRSTSTTADAALAHALALVRGAPFAETPATGYGWAEAIRQDMLAAIVDTAHELAARRLQYGDHRSAEAAVFRGLAVAPDVELLHRDLFYAYASAGARDQLLKAVNRLDALSRRTGRSLDPDTVALLRDLLSNP